MLLSETLRIVNSEYKYIEWIASARIINLRSNGRQVWLCLTFSWLLTTTDIPEYLYRAIVKEYRKYQEQFLKERSKLALYSSSIPARQYDHLRMNSHGELVNHPKKKHLCPVGSYNFDRQLVYAKLQAEADENSYLWRKMNGKRTELAKRASMTQTGKNTFFRMRPQEIQI